MPSSEGHVHWCGLAQEEVTYLEQPLTITANEMPGDPIGTLRVKRSDHEGEGLVLPNSTANTAVWDTVPGTVPALEARQDGHCPSDHIRLRLA